jgi:4-phospho-D-threonate 3-dehydrogenase / 4-phospho-D-erythronate 3-dehydrogenase
MKSPHKYSYIALTPGDPDGIGPEIIQKVLKKRRTFGAHFHPLIIGDPKPFTQSKLPLDFFSSFDSIQIVNGRIPFLVPTESEKRLPGWYSGWAIQTATKLCLEKKAAAIVTGPIDKDRLQKGGFAYFGHTDLLADLCDVKQVTMMLANNSLRVSLVTIHQSLKSVSNSLSEARIHQTLMQTEDTLRTDFGIKKPRIAVLGLNPHCGERGLMGSEEINVILPAIETYRKKNRRSEVEGPFPADTFFAVHYGKKPTKRFDAVVAMYHDQGLIPVKMIDFEETVNITLGLPIIRTSVDHGTAFDIAGKGIASPKSLEAAIRLAQVMIKKGRH